MATFKGSRGADRILAYLETNPGTTSEELAKAAFISSAWIRKLLSLMVEAEMIHVCKYRSGGNGGRANEYALGPSNKPLIPLMEDRAYQATKRREWCIATGYYELRKAQRRIKRGDPVMRALMG